MCVVIVFICICVELCAALYSCELQRQFVAPIALAAEILAAKRLALLLRSLGLTLDLLTQLTSGKSYNVGSFVPTYLG